MHHPFRPAHPMQRPRGQRRGDQADQGPGDADDQRIAVVDQEVRGLGEQHVVEILQHRRKPERAGQQRDLGPETRGHDPDHRHDDDECRPAIRAACRSERLQPEIGEYLHGARTRAFARRQRQDQQDADQEDDGHRHRGAVAGLVLAEEALVQREAQHLGRGARAAAGQQIDFVEHLEGEDQPEGKGHHDGRQHHRQRDVDQFLPDRGAVDLGGLVDVLRQRFQARRETAGSRTASSARYRRRSRTPARSALAPSQFIGSKPIKADELIDEAEVEIEQQFPDRADDDAGDQDRQDEDGPVQHPATASRGHTAAPARSRAASGRRRQRPQRSAC